MKAIIEQDILMRALSYAYGVIEKRNAIPILSNVMIDTHEQSLRISGTNMDMEILAEVPAEIINPGSFTTQAQIIYDITRQCAEGSTIDMHIEQEESGSRLHLRAARSHFKLPIMPAEDFPRLSVGDVEHTFSITTADLRYLIDKTRFAISPEEKNQIYLNGMYIHATQENGNTILRTVTTDAHRLARAEIPCPEAAQSVKGIIIPRKAVNEIYKLIDGEGMVEVLLSPTKIIVRKDMITLTSKLIDATFPDYTRVIPKDNDKAMEVDRKEFLSTISRIAVIGLGSGYPLRMALGKNKGIFSISAPDLGEGEEELRIGYQSEPIEIGFNPSYLREIAAQCKGEVIHFYFSNANAPTMVRDGGDENTLYVLMPMRI